MFIGFTRGSLRGFVVRKGVLKLVLTYSLLFAAVAWNGVQAKEPAESFGASTVALSSLPVQGRETYQLIHQGGPFPFEKDGVTFGNRERLLPGQKRGFYREYTVRTPGSRSRGVRRIVCGGAPTTPEACYYSVDHYANFRKIVP
jgi:ribonuclease T1